MNFQSQSTSYDADDEGLDEAFIFPCHVIFDECHPELLFDYHREYLRKKLRTSSPVILRPRVCEFVIDYMFRNIGQINVTVDSVIALIKESNEVCDIEDEVRNFAIDHMFKNSDSINISIETVLSLIRKVNNICNSEKVNCRILGRTNILNIVFKNILILLEEAPENQQVYLEPLLRFAFTLADYKINANNLKLLFDLIKHPQVDLSSVLSSFEQLLNHQYEIFKNIQPSRSINFPTASRTAQEIESDLYITNSWHWKLRSRVIEYKNTSTRIQNQPPVQSSTPSWLECSIIAPLSNISPLIGSNGVRFSCSMWMSICGDLLVVDRKSQRNQEFSTHGHWHRLTSRSNSKTPKGVTLMHLISFGMDTLTIEIWLNVKYMTFCARACRVGLDSRSNLLAEVTFPSHIESNGSWSHLMFCFEEVNKKRNDQHHYDKLMNLKLLINGVHKEKQKLSYSVPGNPQFTNFACLIGCERSVYGYVWKFSQVNIYKRIPYKDIPMYLLGKGPDFWSFTNFKQQSTIPLADITQRSVKLLLNPKILELYGLVDETHSLNWLTQNIVLAFSAQQPDHFLDYSTNPIATDHEFINSSERFIQAKVLNFSRKLKFNSSEGGFGAALAEAGGIESMMICFADIIRRAAPVNLNADCQIPSPTSSKIQSLAFSILLKMSQTNQYHLSKFLDELNGLKMVEFILVHPDCAVSKQMLDYYLQFCLMKQRGNGERFSLIKSPKLLYHLLSCWRAWHKDLRVAKILYRRLIRLLQPTEQQHSITVVRLSNNVLHCSTNQSRSTVALDFRDRSVESFYINHNFVMLTQTGAIYILLDILRECLVPLDENVAKIDHHLVELIINLISLLIKHPPGLDVMLDITEFLLFLHPDPKSYVEVTTNQHALFHALHSPSSGFAGDINDRSESMMHHKELALNEGLRTPSSSEDESSINSFRSSNSLTETDYNKADDKRKDTDEVGVEMLAIASERFENDTPERKSSTLKREISAEQKNDDQTCSNRNFAIASIADMLASIVKLSQRDPSKILTEALEKSIIDARKLIILANNDSILVREKVLRLFLYCVRACYTLNLKSVLSKYEQHDASIKMSRFRVCLPIQLMAHQLLKYSTTIKMIQLCYGIIVGIDDFETVEKFCLIFDIETMNNNLQLNALILLIQLMTKLREPKDIILAVRFVHAYIKQLLQLGEHEILSVLVENTLIDSLMQLYFTVVKHEVRVCSKLIVESQHETNNNPETAEDTNTSPSGDGNKSEDEKNFVDVIRELDGVLILIIKYSIEKLTTSASIRSIEDLLLQFKLMNTFVPATYQSILRDRSVKVLAIVLAYCAHYQTCAKANSWGKIEYYWKSLFKSTQLNNCMSDTQLEQSSLLLDAGNRTEKREDGGSSTRSPSPRSSTNSNNMNDPLFVSSSSPSSSTSSSSSSSDLGSDEEEDYQRQEESPTNSISENDVIERFKASVEFAVEFVITRESEVISSPFERQFIVKCISSIAQYLEEHHSLTTNRLKNEEQNCHWFLLVLPKLERTLRSCFSRLILYLLSPCDSMNLDERKYYASKILDLFTVEQLIYLMNEGNNKTSYQVLVVFLKELSEYGHRSNSVNSSATQQEQKKNLSVNSEDEESNQSDSSSSEQANEECSSNEEELMTDEEHDIELKLRHLIRSLEQELELASLKGKRRRSKWQNGQLKRAKYSAEFVDNKYRDIWLANLAQAREDARERLQLPTGNEIGTASNIQSRFTNSVENLLATNGDLASISSGTLPSASSPIADRLLEEALKITRDVVNDKHEQRKVYLEELKQNKVHNYHTRQQWLSLIIGHTHERAIWFMENHYPQSWELNPVEGPSRIRRRLRPCKLTLDQRFFRLEQAQQQHHQSAAHLEERETDSVAGDWYNNYSPHPLCSMVINDEQTMNSNELRIRMFTTDRIHFNCDCSIIRPNEVCDGEVSIASWCIHFIGERKDQHYEQTPELISIAGQLQQPTLVPVDDSGYGGPPDSIKTTINSQTQSLRSATPTGSSVRRIANDMRVKPCNLTSTIVEDLWFDEIVEVWDRRYQLQDVGLEIFLTNNITYLISFRSNQDREDFKHNLMREQHKMINLHRFNMNKILNRLTVLWRDGRLRNFDFLTCLNKLAGRSFNDLMQYPVFPFILSNYNSKQLDLNNPENYRNLKRPMAIQREEKEETFLANYQDSQSTSLTMVGLQGMTKPYHYGNHYSNSATVLHFMARLPPFTQMLIQYQDNNFDQPDRTFHSIASTWQLITRDSNTDFKELIPEFFFLPEMFLNFEQLDLGRKQSGELVDDVKLPNWCPPSNARLFTLIHRQALESSYVTEHLHHWIDLVFGFKQTGKPAVEAMNVFHPATYYGVVNLSSGQLQASSSSATLSSLAKSSSSSSSFGLNQTQQQSTATGSLSSPSQNFNGKDNETSKRILSNSLHRQQQHYKRQQADIERLALETMIKTYGQMPRQLFGAPMKPMKRAPNISVNIPAVKGSPASSQQHLASSNNLNTDTSTTPFGQPQMSRVEPLRQVRGLKWGSYVGSPDESDIMAVEHKKIIREESTALSWVGRARIAGTKGARVNSNNGKSYKQTIRFSLCVLPNGDIAILKSDTSLILDYRADRKSVGGHQLSLPSSRYSRRAGLSKVGRMNLFSNMIISRQQFSYIEPALFPSSGEFDLSSNASSGSVSASMISSLTSGPRIKFSPESLSLVSWSYLDGIIRIRHPAVNLQKPSLPLVQADSIVDTMTTCASVPELNLLLVGYKSGSICAHIVSTSHETTPSNYFRTQTAKSQAATTSAALSSSSAAPSAVHFLHTTTSSNENSEPSDSLRNTDNLPPLGPGKVATSAITGEPYSPVMLAGKTLNSVRSMNKASRWLYCHSKKINCIRINVSFGIVVTGSDDGTSVIWDLNTLTYVRTIDYKLKNSSIRKKKKRSCSSDDPSQAEFIPTNERLFDYNPNPIREEGHNYIYGESLSNQQLLGYLCTCDEENYNSNSHKASDSRKRPKNLKGIENDGEADLPPPDDYQQIANEDEHMRQRCLCSSGVSLISISDTMGDIVSVKNISNHIVGGNEECESQFNGFNEFPTNQTSSQKLDSQDKGDEESYLSSVIYIHTINGSLIGFINCHSQVTSVCYSNAPEGVSVNVIVVGLSDGLIRLYSSWDFTRVKEFHVSGLSLPITSLLYSRDNQFLYVIYEDGQLVVLRNKKRNSAALPKEWFL